MKVEHYTELDVALGLFSSQPDEYSFTVLDDTDINNSLQEDLFSFSLDISERYLVCK